MPDYDPLTISDEDMKKLPASERALIYKARRAAATGGAPPPAPPARSAPAAPSSGAATSGTTVSGGTPTSAGAASGSAASGGGTPSGGGTAAPSGGTSAPAAPAAPAAAPKPAAPPPPKEPEKPSEPPFVQHLLKAVAGATFQWRHGYAEMKVPREKLLDAAWLLHQEGFDYLSFITEVDWQDRLELLYHLFAYDYRSQPLGAILRCDLPRDGMPEVASVTPVWPGAEYMEREAFEMMGIVFLGHPDLRRILLPDDFVGFPMRRDYQTDFDYITVKQLVRETD